MEQANITSQLGRLTHVNVIDPSQLIIVKCFKEDYSSFLFKEFQILRNGHVKFHGNKNPTQKIR